MLEIRMQWKIIICLNILISNITAGPNAVRNIIDGDLTITSENQDLCKEIKTITGSLTISKGLTVEAPLLNNVGELVIYEGSSIAVPALNKVPGRLLLRAGSTLVAPNLTEVSSLLRIESNVTLLAQKLIKVHELSVDAGATLKMVALVDAASILLDEGASLEAPELSKSAGYFDQFEKKIVGGLFIKGGALTAPKLTQVHDITVNYGAIKPPFVKLDFPVLKKTSGGITISDGVLTAPLLTHIKGELVVYKGGEVIAPELLKVGKISNGDGGKLSAPKLRKK
ncbi:MAG: hypothetical protein U1F27_08490 [Turneriella sp.]